MGLPSAYQRGGGAAVASYDYKDIAEGTGITIFNGTLQNTSGGSTYVLSSATDYPYSPAANKGLLTSGATITVTAYKTLNFDTPPFNLPRNIKGRAKINFSHRFITGSASSWWNVVKIQKWDGTTATTLVQEQTTSITETQSPTTYNLPLTIPITHFKKNEQLRVSMDLWTDISGATFMIAHDPQNGNNAWFTVGTGVTNVSTTKFEAHIPFVLDL